jgi:hypothetical protein
MADLAAGGILAAAEDQSPPKKRWQVASENNPGARNVFSPKHPGIHPTLSPSISLVDYAQRGNLILPVPQGLR